MTSTLTHYGITGQKWGVRRYQNEDGSLTPAGKKRYSAENLLNVRTNTTTSRLTDKNPSASLVVGLDKAYRKQNSSSNKISNLLNIKTQTSSGFSNKENDFNPLKIQRQTRRDEGISLEEYMKNQKSSGNALKDVKNAVDNFVSKMAKKIKDISKTVVEVGKKVVDKILDVSKKAATKMKDVGSAVSNALKNWNPLNVQKNSSVKRLTQRELDDEMVKKAYGVKK